MTTRAVHLELVTDRSTDTFLMAFRQLTSLRGNPNNCWSVCRTNFIGAQHYLKEIMREWDIPKNWSVVCEEFSFTFHWNWNVPRASHQNVRRALEVFFHRRHKSSQKNDGEPFSPKSPVSQISDRFIPVQMVFGKNHPSTKRPFDRESFSTSWTRRAIKGESKGSR